MGPTEMPWWRWYQRALAALMVAAALFADAMIVVTGGMDFLPVALILAALPVPAMLRYGSVLAHEHRAAETESHRA